MKKKSLTILALVLALACAFAFAACGGKKLTDAPLSGSTLADFTEGEAEAFFESDGWCNGDVFNVTWSENNVTYSGGAAHLAVSEAASSAEVPYLGGELRTYQQFGYGDYSVTMKPAKVAGTASTFFTYTGPTELDENGDPNPHDEIDIEFLGKDTTKVQFNYFVNGKGGHEHMYNLGFDASKEYHEYGFRWAEDYIVWFVDGTPVYKVTASKNNPMPSTAGRILMNHWSGTTAAEGWMGKYTGSNGATCDYKLVKTSATPIGEIPEAPETPDESEVPTTGWVDIDISGFDGWGEYEVDKTDGLTVSHSEAKSGWACCGMSLSDSYSWVRFNVTNNDEENAASVRLDIKDTVTNAGGISGIVCDSSAVKLDTVESAALITLQSGESVDVVLKIKDMYVNQFVIFLNSTSATAGVETGSITISDLQGIVNEDAVAPEVPAPEVPDGDNCVLTFTSTNEYTVDKSGVAAAEINVTYEGLTGGGYNNVQANAAELAAGNDTFSIKITNNGDTAVKLRIDLIGENTITVGDNANMNVCNLSAEKIGGGSEFYTDTTWGGTMITLGAGEEVTVIITYTNGSDMGAVQRVQLYLDSADYTDTDTHSGDVTFGEFKFYNSQAESEEE